jgi:hypothetical protein
MSVPCEGYSRNFPNKLESFWNSLHKERSYSADWKVSIIAFTRNAHTQQIENFLEYPSQNAHTQQIAILENFQSVEYERSL